MKNAPANDGYSFHSVTSGGSQRVARTVTPTGHISAESQGRLYRMFGVNSEFPEYGKSESSSTGEFRVTMTREEIDAKLQLNEARIDTKVAQLDAKIDRVTDLIASLRSDIDRQAKATSESFSQVKSTLDSAKGDNRFTRWTIVVTAITSVIAVVGLVIAVQSSLLSAFQTGVAIKPVAPIEQTIQGK